MPDPGMVDALSRVHHMSRRCSLAPLRARSCAIGAEALSHLATPDRAGARPYQSERHRLIKSAKPGHVRRDAVYTKSRPCSPSVCPFLCRELSCSQAEIPQPSIRTSALCLLPFYWMLLSFHRSCFLAYQHWRLFRPMIPSLRVHKAEIV